MVDIQVHLTPNLTQKCPQWKMSVYVNSVVILSLRELSETTSEFVREELPLGGQSVLICANSLMR